MATGEERVRIATYNIEFLNAGISPQRENQLKAVLASLDADIIGLEEIEDRAALERIFDPSEWSLVIDNQSNDNQDVAAAIRKPFKVISPASLNANDEDFLFPGQQNNSHWPNRRDGLVVEVETPQTNARIFLIVCHCKARSGGRATTEARRVGAARDLVGVLEGQVDERLYAVVGDMNDNPDDRSANILETGDPNAIPGPEQITGPFMINLTEQLLVDDHVSWGLSAQNIVNGSLDTRVPGSRDVNNANRDSNSGGPSPILFDHIVVSPSLHARYTSGSIQVFSDPVTFQGGKASDHVPVFADFVIDDTEGEPSPGPSPPRAGTIRILALLPDPNGHDAGNERVTLINDGSTAVNLAGWPLRDRAGNVKELTGSVAARAEHQVALQVGELPLNNTGDDLELLDADGNVISRFSYTAAQVQRGQEIRAGGVPDGDGRVSLPAPRAFRTETLADALPANLSADMLALLSWNIQTGGTSTSSTALRPPMVEAALSRIVNDNCHIVAAQEIPSTASSEFLTTFLPEPLGPWSAAFTDTTSRMDNGFWFRSGKATLNRHEFLFASGDQDPQGRQIIDASRAKHPPQLAHFSVNDFDFTIVTLHLTFQQGDAEESRREFQVLLDWLDDYFQQDGNDPDVIICGDFNLPSAASGEVADGLTLDTIIQEDGRFEDSARRLQVLVDDKTSRSSAANGGVPASNYDHFIISQDCLEEFVSAHRLPTTALTDDPDDPESRLTSDHFPIMSLFRTRGDGIGRDLD